MSEPIGIKIETISNQRPVIILCIPEGLSPRPTTVDKTRDSGQPCPCTTKTSRASHFENIITGGDNNHCSSTVPAASARVVAALAHSQVRSLTKPSSWRPSSPKKTVSPGRHEPLLILHIIYLCWSSAE